MPFTRPTVTKGRFTIPADQYDGVGQQEFVFHFNPTDIDEGHPPRWPGIKMPGQGNPLYQFGGSDDWVISFTLRLDGDRGRVGIPSPNGKRQRMSGVGLQAQLQQVAGQIQGTNSPSGAQIQALPYSVDLDPTDPASLNINEELNFFRRFAFPGNDGRFSTPPPRVIFNLGMAYQGLECILEVGTIKVIFWTPAMEPVRANVPCKLKVFTRVPLFRSDVLSPSPGNL